MGIVLEKARLSALKAGIAPDTAEAFFVGQIDAAKDIQRFWFDQWKQPDSDILSEKDVKRGLNRALFSMQMADN